MSNLLTADMVHRVARLARLRLSPHEIALFTGQLQHVLHYVAQLDELDLSQVAPLTHAVELSNVFRADEPRPSLPPAAALANAPLADGRYFLVPPILNER